ncbi:hypothetical protein [Viridibacillus arvi]|uniref:hypothetical protein n=1 Tax=Viridibacillus arvi TaxID=263475 RepID=UPI0034CE1F4A
MTQLDEALNKIKSQYEAYEGELKAIENDEEGCFETSVLYGLADSIPFLIETINSLKIELKQLKQNKNPLFNLSENLKIISDFEKKMNL